VKSDTLADVTPPQAQTTLLHMAYYLSLTHISGLLRLVVDAGIATTEGWFLQNYPHS